MRGTGKSLRLSRILEGPKRRAVIVPMDHGVSSGPIAGIATIADTINKVEMGGATAVLVHKGILQSIPVDRCLRLGIILHLSASTDLGPAPDAKTLVTGVEEALALAADAVSVHVNIGSETEKEMLRDLGRVAGDCSRWGVPLLAMAYPRGPKIKDQFNVDVVKHAARVAAELGADLVKTNYTGSVDTFKEVVKGCPVPVVIAGGKKTPEKEALELAAAAVRSGAVGVDMGRNIFQSDAPVAMIKAVRAIVHGKASSAEAYDLFQREKKAK